MYNGVLAINVSGTIEVNYSTDLGRSILLTVVHK